MFTWRSNAPHVFGLNVKDKKVSCATIAALETLESFAVFGFLHNETDINGKMLANNCRTLHAITSGKAAHAGTKTNMAFVPILTSWKLGCAVGDLMHEAHSTVCHMH